MKKAAHLQRELYGAYEFLLCQKIKTVKKAPSFEDFEKINFWKVDLVWQDTKQLCFVC